MSNWLTNLFNRKSSEPSCIAKGVARLWLEKPNEWTEKWGPCFPFDGGAYKGWQLSHPLGVLICTERFEWPSQKSFTQNVGRLTVMANEWISSKIDLLHIAQALETRPYKALAEYQEKLKKVEKSLETTKKVLTELGCPTFISPNVVLPANSATDQFTNP